MIEVYVEGLIRPHKFDNRTIIGAVQASELIMKLEESDLDYEVYIHDSRRVTRVI